MTRVKWYVVNDMMERKLLRLWDGKKGINRQRTVGYGQSYVYER